MPDEPAPVAAAAENAAMLETLDRAIRKAEASVLAAAVAAEAADECVVAVARVVAQFHRGMDGVAAREVVRISASVRRDPLMKAIDRAGLAEHADG